MEDRGVHPGRDERPREKDDDSERKPRTQFSSRERLDDRVPQPPPGRDERPRDKDETEKRARAQVSSRDRMDDRSYYSGRDERPRERAEGG